MEAFSSLLATHKAQIAAVVAGHIPHDFSSSVGGVPLFASPSTVFQFHVSASGAVGEYDTVNGPAYRVLELHEDGALQTNVTRVPMPAHALYPANNSSAGPRMAREKWPVDVAKL